MDESTDLDAAGEAIQGLQETDATPSGTGEAKSTVDAAAGGKGPLGLDAYDDHHIALVVNSGGDMISEVAAGETGLAEKCRWGQSWAHLFEEKGWSLEDAPPELICLVTTAAFGGAVGYKAKQMAAAQETTDDEDEAEGVDNPFDPEETPGVA